MLQAEARAASRAVLRLPEFRFLLCANGLSTLGGRALAVVIGYQIYHLTKNPFYLGLLGLFEAIPAISLALFGGHVADRSDRRRIVLITQSVSVLCVQCFAFFSTLPHTSPEQKKSALYGLYLIVAFIGSHH